MSETTPRLALPLLQAGQAQKEIWHNEAITLLDAIVGGLIETVGDDGPPSAPVAGQAWIVGLAPTGDWTGQTDCVAIRTAGGWRFVAPAEGMAFRLRSTGTPIVRGAAAWNNHVIASSVIVNGEQVVGPRLSGITEPAGGTSVDTEARTALAAVLVTLRTHGLISSQKISDVMKPTAPICVYPLVRRRGRLCICAIEIFRQQSTFLRLA